MRIAIDNVIFQIQKEQPRGISRIWLNLIPCMKKILKDEAEIVLLSRENSLQKDFGLPVYPISQYGAASVDEDDKMLTAVCKKLNVDFFITTYHTRAPSIRNLTVVYDLVPEIRSWGPTSPDYEGRRRSYINAELLVCISENTKKDLYTWYDMSSKKVEVAYPGVSKEFCSKSPEEIELFREKYGVPSNYIILDGGVSKKTTQIFCHAFASLGTNLSIFSYGGSLKDYAIEPCAENNTVLHQIPWLEDKDVPVALSGSKGLVFLSLYEGFGLPVLEAMACRTPVLCSNVASLPEIGGDSIRYFADHSFGCMKNSLSSFFNIKNRKQLVENSHIRSKLFTWEKMAEKIVKMIQTSK